MFGNPDPTPDPTPDPNSVVQLSETADAAAALDQRQTASLGGGAPPTFGEQKTDPATGVSPGSGTAQQPELLQEDGSSGTPPETEVDAATVLEHIAVMFETKKRLPPHLIEALKAKPAVTRNGTPSGASNAPASPETIALVNILDGYVQGYAGVEFDALEMHTPENTMVHISADPRSGFTASRGHIFLDENNAFKTARQLKKDYVNDSTDALINCTPVLYAAWAEGKVAKSPVDGNNEATTKAVVAAFNARGGQLKPARKGTSFNPYTERRIGTLIGVVLAFWDKQVKKLDTGAVDPVEGLASVAARWNLISSPHHAHARHLLHGKLGGISLGAVPRAVSVMIMQAFYHETSMDARLYTGSNRVADDGFKRYAALIVGAFMWMKNAFAQAGVDPSRGAASLMIATRISKYTLPCYVTDLPKESGRKGVREVIQKLANEETGAMDPNFVQLITNSPAEMAVGVRAPERAGEFARVGKEVLTAKDIVQCIKTDTPLPIAFLLVRPHQCFVMGHTVGVIKGGAAGNVFVTNNSFDKHADKMIGYFQFSFTGYMKAAVTQPEAVQTMPCTSSHGYRGGAGTDFWRVTDYDRRLYTDEGRCTARDIFVLPVPTDWKPKGFVLPLAEDYDPAVVDCHDRPRDPGYTIPNTIDFHRDFWGWHTSGYAHDDRYLGVSTDGSNLIVLQGAQYNHDQSTKIRNQGHWGNTFAGCGEVRRGDGGYLQEDARIHRIEAQRISTYQSAHP